MKIKERYRKLNKWIRAGIIVLLLAGFSSAMFFIAAVKNDPNFFMRHFSGRLKLNETKELTFKSDKKYHGGRSNFPVLCFRPEESGEYTITISDIKSDEGVYLKLIVMDAEMSDLISEDNSDDPGSDLSGTALFSSDTMYYVVIEADTSEEKESFEGSFSLTASEAVHDDGPPEIAAGETVRVEVTDDSMYALVFRPEETGFDRFDTMIVKASDEGGFSGVGSVTDENGKEQKQFEGISRLTEGKVYYIGVDTEETKDAKKAVEVDVSCKKIGQVTDEDGGKISISDETVIVYTASSSDPAAIWSVSDGDPRATVYDQNGTPVSMDNDSGEPFSGNAKDFALVLDPEKGARYYIYVGGEFSSCEISTGEYTGDGTSLGPDTVTVSDQENEEAETETETENE